MGSKPSLTERDMVQGSLAVTTADVQASMEGIDKGILNFDVKTFIQEVIDDRCDPILRVCRKYAAEQADLHRRFEEHERTYYDYKTDVRAALNECVKQVHYGRKWEQFETKYKEDIDYVTHEVRKCDGRLNEQDERNERTETTLDYHEGKLEQLEKHLNDTHEFIKEQTVKLEEHIDKQFFFL